MVGLLWGAAWLGPLSGPLPAQEPSGKTYEDLRSQQRRLIDDWFLRLAEVLKKPINPREGYDNAPLSLRTTFDGVTHALLRTDLTDADGNALGNALDIIQHIDDVAGRRPDARSDQQFRIYAQLRPDSYDLLVRSREFRRTVDNTTFHRGYPISFRGNSGTPSIQVSMSRDRQYADIDVDYRSSRVPIGLVNGHLTASNSDIRAGNNGDLHNTLWNGMPSWWRNLFGLPLTAAADERNDSGRLLRNTPRVRNPVHASVADFLTVWLVDKRPDIAIGYLDKAVTACVFKGNGGDGDRGMVPFQLLQGMMRIAEDVGPVKSLSDALVSAPIENPKLRLVRQQQPGYELYDTREDLAEVLKCSVQSRPETASLAALDSNRFGQYYLATFRLKTKTGTGEGIGLLWQRIQGAWRLISYDLESDVTDGQISSISPARVATTETLPSSPGDPGMIREAGRFFTRWFVRRDIEGLIREMDPAILGCVAQQEDSTSATPEARRERLREIMTQMAASSSRTRNLRQAINAIVPFHTDLKLVRHGDSEFYTIVELPDYMADAAACSKRKPGELPYAEPPTEKTYSGHYATGFQLASSGREGEIFWLLWDKTAAGWRVVSYMVQSP